MVSGGGGELRDHEFRSLTEPEFKDSYTNISYKIFMKIT